MGSGYLVAMKRKATAVPMAAEIESRQDQILRMLDELNDRVERALAELGVAPVPLTVETSLPVRVAEAA